MGRRGCPPLFPPARCTRPCGGEEGITAPPCGCGWCAPPGGGSGPTCAAMPAAPDPPSLSLTGGSASLCAAIAAPLSPHCHVLLTRVEGFQCPGRSCTINEGDPYVAVSQTCISNPALGRGWLICFLLFHRVGTSGRGLIYVISVCALPCPCLTRGRTTSIPSSSGIPCGRGGIGEGGGGGLDLRRLGTGGVSVCVPRVPRCNGGLHSHGCWCCVVAAGVVVSRGIALDNKDDRARVREEC